MAVTTVAEADLIREARLGAGQGADGPAPCARLGLAILTRDVARRLIAFAFDGTSTGWSALSSDPPEPPRLSPVTSQDILAMIVSALGLDGELPVPETGYRGVAAGLWALAGLIDAHRQHGLEALLARRMPPPFAVSEDEVELRLIDAATLADPRWLGSLLDMLAGPALAKPKEIEQGLGALRAAGLVVRTRDGRWSPSGPAAGALAGLEAPLAGVAVSLATQPAGGATQGGAGCLPRLIVLVRTLAGLVLIQPTPDQGVELRFVQGSEIITLLGAELARALAQCRNTALSPRSCSICGTRAASEDRFCTSCGAPLS